MPLHILAALARPMLDADINKTVHRLVLQDPGNRGPQHAPLLRVVG